MRKRVQGIKLLDVVNAKLLMEFVLDKVENYRDDIVFVNKQSNEVVFFDEASHYLNVTVYS